MIFTPEEMHRMLEVVKEFGGGFCAYWTHHVFHKVWRVTGKLRIVRRKKPGRA